MATHVVRQGECLTSIARRYGFADPKAIYDDPGNAELRQKRTNPNLLFPGDQVFIPERDSTPITIRTGKRARLVATVPMREIRLVFKDLSGAPLSDAPFRLVAGDREIEGQTDRNGLLEAKVAAGLGTITLEMGGRSQVLRVGSLNPLSEVGDGGVSGVQDRLANLGYPPGPTDGELGPMTAAAIRKFQEESGLETNGRIDEALIRALVAAHGC